MNYEPLYEFAEKHRISYSELCAVAEAAAASPMLAQPDDWNCLESQFEGLMNGEGASEDHADCRALFERAGFKAETVDRLMLRIVGKPQRPWLMYSSALGEEGERYMASFPHAHPLPATFRWEELWSRLQRKALDDVENEPTHAPNTKLLELADRIDHEGLWRIGSFAQLQLTPEQKDRMRAGVYLRRYAELLGNDGWRIFPPRPGFSFRSNTLEGAIEMAKRDELRRGGV